MNKSPNYVSEETAEKFPILAKEGGGRKENNLSQQKMPSNFTRTFSVAVLSLVVFYATQNVDVVFAGGDNLLGYAADNIAATVRILVPSNFATLGESSWVQSVGAQTAATAEISVGIVGRLTESLRVAYGRVADYLARIFSGGGNSDYVGNQDNQKENVVQDRQAAGSQIVNRVATTATTATTPARVALSVSELADIKRYIISEIAGRGLTSNNATVERIVSGLTQGQLDAGLNVLNNQMLAQVANLKNLIASGNYSNFQTIALTSKIDTLSGTALTGVSVNGISGLTDADIPDGITASNYMPLAGGTFTGNIVTNGNLGVGTTSPYAKLSVSGSGVFENNVSASYFTATSTAATSTFPYFTATQSNLGTVVGGTWRGDVVSALFGGTGTSTYIAGDILYASTINPSSLARLPIGVNGQVLKINGGMPSWDTDILGSGGAGIWATTTNSLATYPASPTNVVIVGSNATTSLGNILELYGQSYFSGNAGIGTTSPYAKLSVHANATDAVKPLFVVASSTANSTTTLFAILNNGNVGIGTTSPYAKFSVVGQVVGQYFTATSTINKSLFTGGVNTSGTTGGYSIDNNLILQASSTNFSTLVGQSAGVAVLSDGTGNTALGYQALMTATSSDNNTAVGYRALYSNTTGGNNTAIGLNALYSNTTGGNNTAIGLNVLYANTTGGGSTANGYAALGANTTGVNNTAFGLNALVLNTTGSRNTADGTNVILYNTTGSYNTAMGFFAGVGDNTAQDQRSVIDNYSTFIGYQASRDAAVASTTALSNAIAIGYNARVGASNSMVLGGIGAADGVNVGIGTTSPLARLSIHAEDGHDHRYLFTVASSTATATTTLFSIFNDGNVGIGVTSPVAKLDVAGFINTSGTTGGYKIDGNLILQASSTNNSTLVGQSAGAALKEDGILNTAVGYWALMTATSSSENTAVGYRALYLNTVGYDNTAVGLNALRFNTTGYENTASGIALLYNTTGYGNVAAGFFAGTGDAVIPDQRSVIDNYSTFIGYQASRDSAVASTTVLTNAIAIGYNARVGASNSMVLGGRNADAIKVGLGTSTPYAKLSVHLGATENILNAFVVASSTATATTTLFSIGNTGSIFAPSIVTSVTGNGVCITTAGQITNAGAAACVPSALQFKKNVEDLSGDLAKNIVLNIKPVTYTDKDPANENADHFGFIADWSAGLDKRLVDFYKGDFWSFEYMNYTAVITKFVQDFYAEFQSLLARVTGLENKLNDQQAQIDALRATLAAAGIITAPASTIPSSPIPTPTPAPAVAVEIIMNGNNPAMLNIGDVYGDLGAIASTTDASIIALGVRTFQNGVEVLVPQIDTAVAGTYDIVYRIVDAGGNILAEAIRSVIVQ